MSRSRRSPVFWLLMAALLLLLALGLTRPPFARPGGWAI